MKKNIKTERSGCLLVFGLIFFLVGTGLFAWQGVPAMLDAWRMQSWISTTGTLTAAKLEYHTGDDSTTHQATASYHYDVGGIRYENDRVAIMGGADNVGDFQQNLGESLEGRFRQGEPVTVWFDPDDPEDSVLNREMRWGLLGFLGIFLLAFGGVGAGILFWAWRGSRTIDTPEVAEKPWLSNPEWVDGKIASGAQGGMWFLWFFAGIWNVISLPLLFLFPAAWEEEGAIVLLMLLFPLVGFGLLWWAIAQTRQWRRFGRTILTMDPYPGSIGGDVGGEVLVNMRWDAAARFKATLGCYRSEVRGSGKNRSRRESVVWQDSGMARATVAGEGIKVQFRFEVPEDLPVSEDKGSHSYHLWRVNIHGELPGTDLDRSFEIPVFPTGERSAGIEPATGGVGDTRAPARVEDLIPLRRLGNQVLVQYPAGRNRLRNAMAMGFGAIFAGIGGILLSLVASEGFMMIFMGGIFLLVGLLIALGGLYALLSSLEVMFDGSSVTSVRRIFGVPIFRRQAAYYEIQEIRGHKVFSSTGRNRTTVNYSVQAEYVGGRMTLALDLDSHSSVETVCGFFRELHAGGNKIGI